MIVTIDGPAASGKSTVSRALAQKMGYYYISSGLLYRALGYLLINKKSYTLDTIVNPSKEDIQYCFDTRFFEYVYDGHIQEHIFFAHQDITPYLKESFIDNVASIVSVNMHVRDAITAIQHNIAELHNSVIDGRDVGSVVFPQAEFKFFLTASIEVRAERWRKDQEKYNNFFSIEQAIVLINDRDKRDKNRVVAPLIIPKNAIVIDSTQLSIQETVEKMVCIING